VVTKLKFWDKPAVKCVNCGFFGSRHGSYDVFNDPCLGDTFSQCHSDMRQSLGSGESYVFYSDEGNWDVIACFHHVWSLMGYESDREKQLAKTILSEGRRCPYFYPYRSGFDPAGHNELRRDKANRDIMLTVALINALAVLLGALVTAALRK
jgi:hypothetical protein